ncbi:hypothetical protein KY495_03075 [Massilia sp. PAMC28688]|uniref:hypothetical protein n=1 Tax=Massilia sp. PAMC28688 TaxID=2861283 RepID=UPI001C6395D9|nr:hypothetical protein [Massilia sp. PAMC28688]QYF94223.1 hypothetical protein KY495_03075 [Massilia sp. PAMC28688]
MRSFSLFALAALLTVAGCAGVAPTAPSGAPAVSIVNSLTFDHAMTGKRDGVRTAWPMDKLAGSTEYFPLSQIKQCEPGGTCRWGVLDAKRRFGALRAVPGGVAAEIDVTVHVDRTQHADRNDLHAAMTIPADVGALQSRRQDKREVVLPFGKVVPIDFEHGIRYELCAQRINAARQGIDQCPIAYL